MQLCETITPKATRYYLDGKRVSRALIVAIKGDHSLDTFQTVIKRGVTRHYCCARKEST